MAILKIATVVLALASATLARHSIPEYDIDLDVPAIERYQKVIHDDNGFNATVWKFYNEYFANDKALTDVLDLIVKKRGPEPLEHHEEVEAFHKLSGLPINFIHGMQLLYELQTLMVPIVNFTQLPLPKEYEALSRIPWRGPGCTGIIAMCADGTVSHARNLDFSPVPIMKNIMYVGIFRKGGKEIFRSQMAAGYAGVITVMRKGPNGFTIERNTRYPDHVEGNELMFKNLFSGRPTNGWSLRKIAETNTTYEDAVQSIRTTPYISTEYAIISGVKKGTILSRDPDSVAYTQTLGKANYEERSDYIIITNFDFFDHDIREYFDPTGGQIGYPRRVAAQKMLNSTAVGSLTPEFLFQTINSKGVLADTVFQAVMNVEQTLWNVSIPDLAPKN